MPRPSKGARLWLRKASKNSTGETLQKARWIIRDNGRQIGIACGEAEKEKAEAALANYIAKANLAIPVAEIIDFYLEKSAAGQARPNKSIERADRLLGFFGKMLLSDITGEICRSYISSRQRSVGGAKRDLQDLVAAIRLHAKNNLHRGFIIPCEMSQSIVRSRGDESGRIYFVKADRYVKIGFASNVKNRMITLQTDHYEQLTLLHSMPGDKIDEATLHNDFSSYHHRGEWFLFMGKLKDYIDYLRSAAPNDMVSVGETVRVEATARKACNATN